MHSISRFKYDEKTAPVNSLADKGDSPRWRVFHEKRLGSSLSRNLFFRPIFKKYFQVLNGFKHSQTADFKIPT